MIKAALVRKDFVIIVKISEMPLALIPRFYRSKKKSLIISRSNKMKPPLNASKKTQTVHAGSLKNLRNI